MSVSIINDTFSDIVDKMNIHTYRFCIGLCIKGLALPLFTDSGSSGYIIIGLSSCIHEFSAPTQVFKKKCRFCIMAGFCHIYDIVSIALQLFYIIRFSGWKLIIYEQLISCFTEIFFFFLHKLSYLVFGLVSSNLTNCPIFLILIQTKLGFPSRVRLLNTPTASLKTGKTPPTSALIWH